MKQHANREDWLSNAVDSLSVSFDILEQKLPQKIRIACGFPLHASRGKTGETWQPKDSADGTVEILVSPAIQDPAEILSIVIHELIHSTGIHGHGIRFAYIAGAMGLIPSKSAGWKQTTFDRSFEVKYQSMLSDLGPYPHAQLSAEQAGKTQITRMMKLQCRCGYLVRTTEKWIKLGLPTCHCGNQFIVETK